MLVLTRRGGNRSTQRKTSRWRVENQETQPTYDAESENRTRATLVGSGYSHHCAIPTRFLKLLVTIWNNPMKLPRRVQTSYNMEAKGYKTSTQVLQATVNWINNPQNLDVLEKDRCAWNGPTSDILTSSARNSKVYGRVGQQSMQFIHSVGSKSLQQPETLQSTSHPLTWQPYLIQLYMCSFRFTSIYNHVDIACERQSYEVMEELPETIRKGDLLAHRA